MSDTTALEKLQAELFPGEKLLWHGRPVQGIRYQRSDMWAAIFGVPFLGFALFLTLLVFGIIPMPHDWLVNNNLWLTKCNCVFGTVTLLPVGLYLLGGGLWLDSRLRRQLFFGVTNERILILRESRHKSQSLTSLRLRDVPHLTLRVSQDGTGSLYFALRPTGAQGDGGLYGICFRLIPEVRKVYTLIRSIQRDSV
jgi:hypothetical protein